MGTSRYRSRTAGVWLLACLAAQAPPLGAQQADLEGHWEGSIEIPGTRLEIDLDFARDGEGWSGDISIPAQNAQDLPLSEIALEGSDATFKIPGIPGDPTFEGDFVMEGDAVKEVEFRQPNGVFTARPRAEE